jgi:hypothetical protein
VAVPSFVGVILWLLVVSCDIDAVDVLIFILFMESVITANLPAFVIGIEI